ncbi:MAG: hypothetical protein IJV39_03325 [Ruminococcus sp.]|nr:hypothetical protein [Ruminococcus sp.]
MTKLIFIEGISGVGKSTMVRKICEDLTLAGKTVKGYVEFDYTNPIDFYCVAYYTTAEYENLCTKYEQYKDLILKNTVDARSAKLIHYFDEDTPLFEEPLLSEFMKREFCYNPQNPVTLQVYSEAYTAVWKNFISSLKNDVDYIIFDGSLLHHPINDMIRNYGATKKQVFGHIQKLLATLDKTEHCVYYLKTEDIVTQLSQAYIDRGQQPPDSSEITFWKKRYDYDSFVLNHIDQEYQVFDVKNKWDAVKNEILNSITS